jgi:type IV pilus assembly protein PilM
VVASLPESQIFTRVIDMPVLTDNELQSAIKYEAEQYIPIPLSEVKLDYQVLDRPHSQTGDKKMDVLLVAAPNVLIKRYLRIIEQAGFKPYALETEITANSRSLININKMSLTSMVVDIGASTTKLAIVADRKIAFTRSLAIGGSAFSRAVAQGLGFEIDQAEQYKDTYGLDDTQLEGKIAVAIKPIFDVITNEMQRALAFWSGRHPDVVVKTLMATGGSAKMPGLIPYLTAATGLEGQIGNTWETFSFGPNVSPTIRDDSPFYSIAAGLAMKDIVGG